MTLYKYIYDRSEVYIAFGGPYSNEDPSLLFQVETVKSGLGFQYTCMYNMFNLAIILKALMSGNLINKNM